MGAGPGVCGGCIGLRLGVGFNDFDFEGNIMRNATISLAVLSALALALAACSPQATLPGQGEGNSKSPDAIGQSAAAAKGESQAAKAGAAAAEQADAGDEDSYPCLLYTSDAADEQ